MPYYTLTYYATLYDQSLRFVDPDTLNIFYFRPLRDKEVNIGSEEFPTNYSWSTPQEVQTFSGRISLS